jgi:hypothetical protein
MERTGQGRSYDPNSGPYGEDGERNRIVPYSFGRTARPNDSRNSVPLFVSDPEGEPDPEEYVYGLETRRKGRLSSRLLMATVAAAALAALYAFFASDASRDIIINARASIAAALPGSSVAAHPVSDAAGLTPRDVQLEHSARTSLPVPAATDKTKRTAVAALTPTREVISSTEQSTLPSQTPDPSAVAPTAALPAVAAPPVAAPAVAAPPVAVPAAAAPAAAAPPARHMDPDELATLMQRAKAMLAVGDISSARLLLERAAEAPDANAALMLAQTYDPQVLGASDVRSVVPEPAKARIWYQKAALLGSADAQRRLAQLAD